MGCIWWKLIPSGKSTLMVAEMQVNFFLALKPQREATNLWLFYGCSMAVLSDIRECQGSSEVPYMFFIYI